MHADAEVRVRDAYTAGIAEGRRSAAGDIEPMLHRFTKSMDEIVCLKPRLRKEAEADVVRLAMAIAKRILRRELSVDPEVLQGVVATALEKLQARDIVRVRVHRDFEDTVRIHLSSTNAGSVDIVPDPALQPGDVLFETTRGTLDASLDSQLREIERGFTDVLGG